MRAFITALIAAALLCACSGNDSISALGKVSSQPQARGLSSTSYSFQVVDDPVSGVNRVNGIDLFGDIVGSTGSGTASDPYQSYFAQSPYNKFQSESYPGAQGTVAMAVVSPVSQTIVGGWVLNPPQLPGIWVFVQINGVFTIFRDRKGGRGPDTASAILGLNDVGFGVGYFKNTDGHDVPVVINIPTEKFTALKPPGFIDAEATGINDFGDIGGWETTSKSTVGFFERLGAYYTFAHAKATATYGLGINSSDQIVGYYTDTSGANHGFILTSPKSGQKWQTIDAPDGANGTFVTGINDHGAICGYYVDASHVQHGFVATAKR
ncbi:MAG TPA: hypothetical protein VHR97_10395 [Candidatus Baltobacteraceae bacterium]|jgi:hypothetical protein|nr:hypothetical protein [Candidatus Baltobacteraceae bacterium]